MLHVFCDSHNALGQFINMTFVGVILDACISRVIAISTKLSLKTTHAEKFICTVAYQSIKTINFLRLIVAVDYFTKILLLVCRSMAPQDETEFLIKCDEMHGKS